MMSSPWAWSQVESKPIGTSIWRAYFRDRPSFCFGLWVGHDADAARKHAEQWGDVIRVELVK